MDFMCDLEPFSEIRSHILCGVDEVEHAFLTDQLDEVTSDFEYSYIN